MKRNDFFIKKTLFTCAILTFVFVMCGVVAEAQASFTSSHGTANPQTEVAKKLNVVAYPLGTFDRQTVISKLEALKISLNSISNPSLQVRMKLAYVSKILIDVNEWHIATEISLIKRVYEVGMEVGSSPTQLKNLYNEIVAEID